MSKIEISRIGVGDEADWRRLWADYLAFYETTLPAEVFAASFARITGPDAREFKGLIARADGRACGLAHYLFHRDIWQIEDRCYLQDLFVDPAMRGKQVGKALIEAVFRAADEAGSPSAYWMTAKSNAQARRLYDRIGVLTPFIEYNRI